MWTRAELKSRAKEILRLMYGKAFLVSLVILISGHYNNGGSSNFRLNSNNRQFMNTSPSYIHDWIFSNLGLVFFGIGTLISFILLYRILIGFHLEVGSRRFFIKASEEKNSEVGVIGYAFSGGGYINIIKTMIYRAILIFLWTLLLIIPGIIKTYAYRMVPYILADNPEISFKRAIELSNQMTDGHKFDIFVLDLSFLGWYFLGALALGVGVLFVMPYDHATNAELYRVLRQNALNTGLTSYGELFNDYTL